MRILTIAAAVATLMSTPAFADDPRLEPAINGAVSADGSYASQAGQDWYQAQQRIGAELQAEHRLAVLHQAGLDAELEPCINGQVSATGRFASAELLRDSVYLGATVDG